MTLSLHLHHSKPKMNYQPSDRTLISHIRICLLGVTNFCPQYNRHCVSDFGPRNMARVYRSNVTRATRVANINLNFQATFDNLVLLLCQTCIDSYDAFFWESRDTPDVIATKQWRHRSTGSVINHLIYVAHTLMAHPNQSHCDVNNSVIRFSGILLVDVLPQTATPVTNIYINSRVCCISHCAAIINLALFVYIKSGNFQQSVVLCCVALYNIYYF